MYSIQIKDTRIKHQQKITEIVVGTLDEIFTVIDVFNSINETERIHHDNLNWTKYEPKYIFSCPKTMGGIDVIVKGCGFTWFDELVDKGIIVDNVTKRIM